MAILKDRACVVCGIQTQAYDHETFPSCLNCASSGKTFETVKKASIKSKCVECSNPVESGVLVSRKGLLCNSCYSSHMMKKGITSPKASDTERKIKMSEQPEEVTNTTQVTTTEPLKKKRTVVRLGQTKLIDKLLKEGKTDEQVIDQVKLEIPQYPAEKLPQLVKIRKAHLKKAQQGAA